MRARLAVLVAATAVILAIAPAHPVGAAFAAPVCPDGTNWDNSLNHCL